MSKVNSRKKHPRSSGKPEKQKTIASTARGSKKQAVILIIVFILAAVPFCLGKYIEINSPDAFDSGAYIYSAKHILDGARIGIDEIPSAQLGTLLVNMLGVWLFGFNETGPEVIMTIFQVLALVFLFVSMRKLFGVLSASVGVIIASVYLSAPLIAKFGNVKEQYMIAVMVSGMSFFVLYQLSGSWWQCLLAGAFLSWGPLFKPTGMSAIGAFGVFVIMQPLLKHKTLKQTGIDILLLLAGAAAALAPLYIWIIGWDIQIALPYEFAWKMAAKKLSLFGQGTAGAKASGGYLGASRKLVPFSQQWPRVLRHYGLLMLPIGLALCAITARLIRMILSGAGKLTTERKPYDRFVLLFGVWWFLDMAFVWISPRSYEQYYLPLNASAAMLGGYFIALYSDKLNSSIYKTRWLAVGAMGFLCMAALSWHIFFGIKTSPFSGKDYGEKRRGYAQQLQIVNQRRKKGLKTSWEIVGDYIRNRTEPEDKIYVWGWYPGIYVKAQRFSPTAKAFTMPRPAPEVLARQIDKILADFKIDMPKFIVDSRKRHIPMERPPYELWPIVPKGLIIGSERQGFLPRDKEIITQYDRWWSKVLRQRFDDAEADRYDILAVFREFVRENYDIAEQRGFIATKDGRTLVHRIFGDHVVFRLKNSNKNAR